MFWAMVMNTFQHSIGLTSREVARGCHVVLLAVIFLVAVTFGAGAQTAQSSGPPLPRFASLKSSKVNVRRGPGKEYPIAWVFKSLGLPVEIIKEYENWRQVRDSEAAVGWIHAGLLSGRRTAIVAPWAASNAQSEANVALYASRSNGKTILAYVEPGTVIGILQCDGAWCEISVDDFRGWMAQSKLWGIYPNERLK